MNAELDPLIGVTVDKRFRVIALLGRGATTSVYEGLDEDSQKQVALKFLHSKLVDDALTMKSFFREARTVATLNDLNIVSLYHFGMTERGRPYLVTEFVPGITMKELLAQNGYLRLREAIPLFAQICSGLSTAHQKNVIHRNLKPGKILLTSQETKQQLVKLLGFGKARVAPMHDETRPIGAYAEETLAGSLYSSPEVFLAGEIDPRSDCYSLGCVLYECLTGRPPFIASELSESMNQHLNVSPPSLDEVRPDLQFSKDLESVVFKAMAKEPENRYQNVVDFIEDLRKFAN